MFGCSNPTRTSPSVYDTVSAPDTPLKSNRIHREEEGFLSDFLGTLRLLFNHHIGLAFIADQLAVSRVREGEQAGEATISPRRCACGRAAIATGSRVRPTERSSGQRSNSGREEMGCSGSGAVARGATAAEARRWLCAAILLGQSQQNKGRRRGNRVMVTLFRSTVCRQEAAAPWSIRERCVCRVGDRWCQCAGALARLETGEAAGISLLWRKKGCEGCDNSISARWEIDADLVGSVCSGGRCRDSRWTGVDDKICMRPKAVETCCRLTAIREFALSKLL
ncbi:hypothetical protein BHE74_00042501 [Ensete ventricosum]|nr:hypothetical protein BHE74_00042501 [Ensete ventricosum]